MDRKKIKIIAHYSDDYGRGPCAPSCKNKLDYIISSFIKNGISVEILSVASITNGNNKQAYIKDINKNLQIKYPRGFSKNNVFQKIIYRLFNGIVLLNFLTKNISKNDLLYVYHSTALMGLVSIIKRTKKAKVILELEEIYGDVLMNEKLSQKEIKYASNIADSYIFPTKSLNKLTNLNNKPYVIIHGTYKVEDIVNKPQDDYIHCVYAGTFNPSKGVLSAIRVAKYLPANYMIHIIGFGTEEEINCVKHEIQNVTGQASVSYDGLLLNDEYTSFLQKCDIGLCTQGANNRYTETSFPSKILSYMANGLRVVCPKIPVIEESKIKNDVSFYSDSNIKEFANAILRIDLNDNYDGRKTIIDLATQFEDELLSLYEQTIELR